jgi:ATP-dependent DNA ligase
MGSAVTSAHAPSGRLHPALHPDARLQGALRSRLKPRGQARRLSAAGAPGGPSGGLFTRRGYDWTERYPAIAAAAAKVRAQSFTLDGEAVVCGADGIALFDAPHRHGTVHEAILQTFDLLELMASTSGQLPLAERKTRLARLLRRRPAFS